MDDLLEFVLQYLFDVRLGGMAVACAVNRQWYPVVTRVDRRTFCRASYDPVFLRRLSLQEPHQAGVERLVGIAQSAGDHFFMDMVEFRKLVVLQLTLQQWRVNRSYISLCAFTKDNNFVSSVNARCTNGASCFCSQGVF